MSFVNVEIDETECCEVVTPLTEVGDGLESVCDPIREIAWELAEANHPLAVGLENTLGDLDESLGSISQSNEELTLENRRLAVKVNDLIHRLESQRNDSEDLIEFLYERATRFEADLQRLAAHNVARPQRTRPRAHA